MTYKAFNKWQVFAVCSLLVWAFRGAAEEGVPEIIRLWPEGAVESSGLRSEETMADRGGPGDPDRRFQSVPGPDLEIFRVQQPNGIGVLILPGGGYGSVVIDKEGREVARWFNSIGVTAVVLKYRLPKSLSEKEVIQIRLRRVGWT
jgi:acetyl esterase/lipase